MVVVRGQTLPILSRGSPGASALLFGTRQSGSVDIMALSKINGFYGTVCCSVEIERSGSQGWTSNNQTSIE